MTDIQERLAEMDDAYKAAEAPAGMYDLPPDGCYQATIKRFDFPMLENESVYYLKTEYVIEHDPEYAGREVSTLHNLENPDRIGWVKKHLETLGYDGLLSELPIKLGAFVGSPVELTIKTSNKTDKDGKPYRNVYLDRKLGAPISDVPANPDDFKVPAAAPAGGAEEEEEIPFLWREGRYETGREHSHNPFA